MNREWKKATKQSDLERVRGLLESGIDINAKDEHGQTALMNAAHAGQIELVRLLVEQGADLNLTAKYNLSALMLALIARQAEIARLLLEVRADLNIRGTRDFSGVTALSLAKQGGLEEIAILIKDSGAISWRRYAGQLQRDTSQSPLATRILSRFPSQDATRQAWHIVNF